MTVAIASIHDKKRDTISLIARSGFHSTVKEKQQNQYKFPQNRLLFVLIAVVSCDLTRAQN